MTDISALVGLTLASAYRTPPTAVEDEIVFESTDGRRFVMHHEQECCESVGIDDIAGDLDDLVGSPILIAEEVSNEDVTFTPPERVCVPDSEMWTFYKLATAKGYVTIRWYGQSNGYYSESVQFRELPSVRVEVAS